MLSAVVLTRNEEENIVDCLESLSFCDEVIVLDDNSEDRTVEVAKRASVKVITRALNGDFSIQRNFGLKKARGDWVLFIDADERVTEELKTEFTYLIKLRGRTEKLNGYFIKRQDIMWGKQIRFGETGSIRLLRLARKDAGLWEGKVHEEWKVTGEIGELENPILHYPHQTVREFLQEINFYTSLRAQELYTQGVRVRMFSIFFFPLAKFFLNYGVLRGFVDGLPGFIVALMMSFHSFLVRGKLWLLWQKA